MEKSTLSKQWNSYKDDAAWLSGKFRMTMPPTIDTTAYPKTIYIL